MKRKLIFFKYQSLGNDFILLDWLDESKYDFDANWSKLVQCLCDRHYGIGADGVLIIRKNGSELESLIFNADGSYGDKCLNGLRCVAHYLVIQKNYPPKLEIFMGNKLMQCEVGTKVTINVGQANYQKQQQIQFDYYKIFHHSVF